MGLFSRDDTPPESPQPVSTPKPAPRTPTPAPATPPKASGEATLIARTCEIEGHLSGSGDVNIHGRFKGQVSGSGQLFIAESGHAEATLHARTIVVAGTVTGDLTANEKIELRPSATLHGNITAPRILIQEGATFEGQVFMKSPGEPKAAAAPAAKATDEKGDDTGKDTDEKDTKKEQSDGKKEPSGSKK
jgi:cytoskeletal protein CcmA (bactofilin family)